MNLPPVADLLNWSVAAYLAAVLFGQLCLGLLRRSRANATKARRHAAGLDDQILVDHSITLKALRRWSMIDAVMLLVTVVGVPILLAAACPENRAALGTTFLILLIWVLVSATNIAKAFLGGVAFRAYVGLRQPFQVGDRVTLLGHGGKVEEIDPFFVRLTTLTDDKISIPTASLWGEPLVSANAGERASLVEMAFHLAPFVSAEERKVTEDAIWDAIQRSVYWDFDKPMQIYVEQRRDEIILTATAYVASTYNELLFKSDVYQAFLNFADRERIPLASTDWRRKVP